MGLVQLVWSEIYIHCWLRQSVCTCVEKAGAHGSCPGQAFWSGWQAPGSAAAARRPGCWAAGAAACGSACGAAQPSCSCPAHPALLVYNVQHYIMHDGTCRSGPVPAWKEWAMQCEPPEACRLHQNKHADSVAQRGRPATEALGCLSWTPDLNDLAVRMQGLGFRTPARRDGWTASSHLLESPS